MCPDLEEVPEEVGYYPGGRYRDEESPLMVLEELDRY
jgi:hypothetical protein